MPCPCRSLSCWLGSHLKKSHLRVYFSKYKLLRCSCLALCLFWAFAAAFAVFLFFALEVSFPGDFQILFSSESTAGKKPRQKAPRPPKPFSKNRPLQIYDLNKAVAFSHSLERRPPSKLNPSKIQMLMESQEIPTKFVKCGEIPRKPKKSQGIQKGIPRRRARTTRWKAKRSIPGTDKPKCSARIRVAPSRWLAKWLGEWSLMFFCFFHSHGSINCLWSPRDHRFWSIFPIPKCFVYPFLMKTCNSEAFSNQNISHSISPESFSFVSKKISGGQACKPRSRRKKFSQCSARKRPLYNL